MSTNKIVLSPEIAVFAEAILAENIIPFDCGSHIQDIEDKAKSLVELLPSGVLGFRFNNQVFLKKAFIVLLPQLESDFIFPEKEEQLESENKI